MKLVGRVFDTIASLAKIIVYGASTVKSIGKTASAFAAGFITGTRQLKHLYSILEWCIMVAKSILPKSMTAKRGRTETTTSEPKTRQTRAKTPARSKRARRVRAQFMGAAYTRQDAQQFKSSPAVYNLRMLFIRNNNNPTFKDGGIRWKL